MESLFQSLAIWNDIATRSPAEHMAVDEALLLSSQHPVLRLYSWVAPAVTFGCAQRFAEAAGLAGGHVAIRRWTGGGVVFHGQDLTLSVALPSVHEAISSRDVYRILHDHVVSAIQAGRPVLRLANDSDIRNGTACFVNPALHDVMDGQTKICGGALRRGKSGILYQGSLAGSSEAERTQLAQSFGEVSMPFENKAEVEERAARLVVEKYGTPQWNLRR